MHNPRLITGASNDKVFMAAAAINLSEILKDVPPGAWAAVYRYKVVAFGADVQRVLAEARSKGVPDPLIVKVPDRSEALFL